MTKPNTNKHLRQYMRVFKVSQKTAEKLSPTERKHQIEAVAKLGVCLVDIVTVLLVMVGKDIES